MIDQLESLTANSLWNLMKSSQVLGEAVSPDHFTSYPYDWTALPISTYAALSDQHKTMYGLSYSTSTYATSLSSLP